MSSRKPDLLDMRRQRIFVLLDFGLCILVCSAVKIRWACWPSILLLVFNLFSAVACTTAHIFREVFHSALIKCQRMTKVANMISGISQWQAFVTDNADRRDSVPESRISVNYGHES